MSIDKKPYVYEYKDGTREVFEKDIADTNDAIDLVDNAMLNKDLYKVYCPSQDAMEVLSKCISSVKEDIERVMPSSINSFRFDVDVVYDESIYNSEILEDYKNPKVNDKENFDELELANFLSDEMQNGLDPEVTYLKLEEIRTGLKHGLTSNQVRIYANPDFLPEQMRQIRYGLETGFTIDEVKAYAKPEMSADEMFFYRIHLEREKYRNEFPIGAKVLSDDVSVNNDDTMSDPGLQKRDPSRDSSLEI